MQLAILAFVFGVLLFLMSATWPWRWSPYLIADTPLADGPSLLAQSACGRPVFRDRRSTGPTPRPLEFGGNCCSPQPSAPPPWPPSSPSVSPLRSDWDFGKAPATSIVFATLAAGLHQRGFGNERSRAGTRMNSL
jgi:hypothetical protein